MQKCKKIIFTLSFITFFLLPGNISAKDEFNTFLSATYTIDNQGSAKVRHEYTLENLSSETLAKEFHVNFTYLVPEDITVSQDGTPLKFESTKEQNSTYLKIFLGNDFYGKGKKRTFNIDFKEKNISKKTGNILEVSIPKINSSDLDRFVSRLETVGDVGPLAYISPSVYVKETDGDKIIYNFSDSKTLTNGIKAAFGEFQVFDFNLIYNLRNTSTKAQYQEIAIPPDTPYQKVYITKVDPTPANSTKDDDGNWLFNFKLSPLEKKSISVEGSVQLFSNPRSLTIPSPQSILNNLNPTKYWHTDSEVIKKLANELRTPENIYKYVVNNLKYDFNRVTPQSERFGSIKALQMPNNSLCTEFTDLFIAIARAAGIPAREIQGYAFTQNDKLQPLSLISDVLHAWPEYWDNEKRTWVSVDPTWESTTSVDYFNKFDLNHFAFVIHGVSDEDPAPAGSYKFSDTPKKDVFVRYGKLPESSPKTDISATIKHVYNPFTKNIDISVKNNSAGAVYNEVFEIITNENNPNEETIIASIIPFSSYNKTYKLNYGVMAKNIPDSIILKLSDSEYKIDTQKEISIISQVAVVLTVIFLIVGYFAITHRRLR